MKPEIRTYSDFYFNFVHIDPDTIVIEDIAHALSNTCRFGGHCKQFYSVAQHSVHVSKLVDRELALQGLMHDAAEAYVGDIPKPLKNLLQDYQRIEHAIEMVIFKKFNLPLELHEQVKHFDLVMLSTEKRDLNPTPRRWTTDHVPPSTQLTVDPWPPLRAKVEFMERFRELTRYNALYDFT